jgi:hypothetical protein
MPYDASDPMYDILAKQLNAKIGELENKRKNCTRFETKRTGCMGLKCKISGVYDNKFVEVGKNIEICNNQYIGDDWYTYFDNEAQAHYFYNENTGEATWIPPKIDKNDSPTSSPDSRYSGKTSTADWSDSDSDSDYKSHKSAKDGGRIQKRKTSKFNKKSKSKPKKSRKHPNKKSLRRHPKKSRKH